GGAACRRSSDSRPRSCRWCVGLWPDTTFLRGRERMPIRYVITTLKPGVKPEEYEKWLREYHYPVAKTLPSIVSYRTHRIEGPINGAEGAGWCYIERIEIRDKDAYARDIA